MDTVALVSFDGDDVALSTVRIARDGSGLVAWIREDGQAGVVRAGDDLHATGCAAVTTVEPGMRLLRVTATGDHDVEAMFLRDDDDATSFLRWNATLVEED